MAIHHALPGELIDIKLLGEALSIFQFRYEPEGTVV